MVSRLIINTRRCKKKRPHFWGSSRMIQFLCCFLLMLWILYLIGIVFMAVGVHKLNPMATTAATTVPPTIMTTMTTTAGATTTTTTATPKKETSSRSDESNKQSITDSTDKLSLHHVMASSSTTTTKTETNGNKKTKENISQVKFNSVTSNQIEEEYNEKKPQKKKVKRPNYKPKPLGFMVEPELVLPQNNQQQQQNNQHYQGNRNIPNDQILTAYLEPIDRSTWDIQPLPVRTSTADDLEKRPFSKLNSCSRLPEQWPVNEYPDEDPFLPWIHDVFPTFDGKYIQFVAQNKRRCRQGHSEEEDTIYQHMAPQVSLFEHVPLKKINEITQQEQEDEPRYRLSSHEDADPESMATRFICRFKPSGDITFSEFNNDYEWVAFRKGQKRMFSIEERDYQQIQTSQLLFRCPVPDHLIELVRTGESVKDDWATLFLDLIPIRTPPRTGPPQEFLVPRYRDSVPDDVLKGAMFDAQLAWGENHILPKIEDSGRWENIPICRPSLMEYEPEVLDKPDGWNGTNHHLVSCLWASVGYTTRGNRYAINDGQRRLIEWISFNKMIGFDHFYIYDNSGAFTDQSSLRPIVDVFPGDVTVINWPSQVCNNNPNNADSPGERSSQYAAESSCRLRFGPHVNWIGQFDIDEYLVPMGEYTSVLPLLEKLDREDKKILSFASWKASPRWTHINDPVPIHNGKLCWQNKPCFEVSVPSNTTMLEAYNCDREKPGERKHQMPAEKQIYRADYVKQHFVHYSTVTESTNLRFDEYMKMYGRRRVRSDPKARFVDEVNEALMLHSKAIARQETAGWTQICQDNLMGTDKCRIGFPWPADGNETVKADKDGWRYNCYAHKKIDDYWGPRLREKLKGKGFM